MLSCNFQLAKNEKNVENVDFHGFEMSGFEMSGFEMSGFEMSGFEMSGLEMSGFEMSGLEMSRFAKNTYILPLTLTFKCLIFCEQFNPFFEPFSRVFVFTSIMKQTII